MDNLNTVLIIDDDADAAARLATSMADMGKYVLTLTKRPKDDDLTPYLKSADFITIDWNLSGWLTPNDQAVYGGDGSRLALSYLDGILSKTGLPGVIYTEVALADVQSVLSAREWYQQGLYPVVGKKGGASSNPIDELKRRAKEQAENVLSVMIGLKWKPQVRTAVNAAIAEIASWRSEVLTLFADGFQADQQEFGSAVTAVLNQMLEQYLPVDDQLNSLFNEQIRPHLQAAEEAAAGQTGKKKDQVAIPTNDKVLEQFHRIQAFLTYMTADKIEGRSLETGDILVLDQEAGIYGLVITPRCDVIRSKSVKLLMGQDLSKRQAWRGKDSEPQLLAVVSSHLDSASEKEFWLLNAEFGDQRMHLVFHFNWVKTVTTPANAKVAEAYADCGKNGTCPSSVDLCDFPQTEYIPWGQRVARLRSPYLDVLMENYSRHQLRKGLPTPPRIERTVLAQHLAARIRKKMDAGSTVQQP